MLDQDDRSGNEQKGTMEALAEGPNDGFRVGDGRSRGRERKGLDSCH